MLYFENVRLLTYTHTPILLGAGLRYRIEKHFSFEGTLIDKTNPEGVNAILSKETSVMAGAIDYDDIIIAGINFGKGKIININFDGGTLARDEKYTYEISCYEDGDLSNATTGVYSSIDWSALSTNKITNISEEFSFNEADNGDLQFVHNVTIQYSQYSSKTEGMTLAKALATVLFNNVSGIGAYVGGLNNYTYAKTLYAETYNEVECAAQYTQTISIPADPVGDYSYSVSYNAGLDEQGFLTVTEQLNIVGLTSPRNAGAEEGYTALSSNAYTRCSAIASAYNFSDVSLSSLVIQSSKAINKFTGKIEVNTTFSNNPKYNSTAIWEYTTVIDRNEQGVYNVSERGEVIGIGVPGENKYTNALSFFNSTVKANINARLDAAYATTDRNLTLTLINQTLDKNQYLGRIKYNYTKTDNKLNADPTYKRVSIEVTTSNPVHINPKFQIFNYKEIVQPQNQSSLGKVSVNIELKGSRSTQLNTFLTDAKSIASTYKPAGVDTFLQECQYSYIANTSVFTLQASFAFTGTKEASDLTLN